MQTSSEAGIESDVVAQFVKQAKPKTDKAIFHLLVWSWGVLVASVAVYCAFPSIWTFAFAFLVITSRMGALLALAHDAQHSAFLPNKKWNDLIGAWFCAYPMGSIFGSSRAVHMAHHKLLNTPDDPDRNFHIEHDKSTPRQFVVHFARLVFGGQLWTSIVVNGFLRPKSATVNGNGNGNGSSKPVVVVNRAGHPEILNLVPVQLVIWGSLWLASGQWWLYFALWLGPIFTLGTFLGFLRGFVDHARLASEDEGATSGRLITVVRTNWLERAFLAPFHFNYHAEHHLFPAVPPYYLPQLHKLLQSEPAYRNRYGVRPSYGQFLNDYWRQISRSAERQGQTAPDHS
jgi:fatty acid desaturase